MTISNNYSIHFSYSQIVKAEPEHLLNWQQRWPNFSPGELSSKDDGSLLVHYDSLDKLQLLRTYWRRPLRVTSAFRTAAHNAKVGGAPKSQHLIGKAFDISAQGWADSNTVAFIYYATKAGFTGFGLYLDRPVPFIHIDTGKVRTWQSGQSRLDDTDDVTEIMPSI